MRFLIKIDVLLIINYLLKRKTAIQIVIENVLRHICVFIQP